MNAAIGLCVFCEIHGPRVIFTTQTHRDLENHSTEKLKFYGSKNVFLNQQNEKSTQVQQQRCPGCSSLGNVKYLSNDDKTRTSFLSVEKPLMEDVENLLNYACVRSLSCEVYSPKEGVCYFGDEHRGHVLSHTFTLKDSQARGFRRWCSFIVLMKDKQFLLNMWPFLIDNLKEIISELQSYAAKKYNAEEENNCSRRAARIDMANSRQNSRTNLHKQPSSLIEITAEKYIFVRIHMRLTWILCAGATHFVEKLAKSIPSDEVTIGDLKYSTDTTETLTKSGVELLSMQNLRAAVSEKCPISILRSLKETLGKEQFQLLLYATLTGVQILIRGPRLETLESIYGFCFLVPENCRKIVAMATEYVDTNSCNFLGVYSTVAVPVSCADICRLDILSVKNATENSVNYFIKSTMSLPTKLPTLMTKIQNSLENTIFVSSALRTHLSVLQEEWLNIAKMVHALKAQKEDKIHLIKILGGGPHDEKLLDAWVKI